MKQNHIHILYVYIIYSYIYNLFYIYSILTYSSHLRSLNISTINIWGFWYVCFCFNASPYGVKWSRQYSVYCDLCGDFVIWCISLCMVVAVEQKTATFTCNLLRPLTHIVPNIDFGLFCGMACDGVPICSQDHDGWMRFKATSHTCITSYNNWNIVLICW